MNWIPRDMKRPSRTPKDQWSRDIIQCLAWQLGNEKLKVEKIGKRLERTTSTIGLKMPDDDINFHVQKRNILETS